MKSTITLLLIISSFLATSQITKEKFESRILGGDREISIYTPPSFNKKNKKEYPLLLVLDANYLFNPFQGIVSYSSYWEEVPEMIIVGVHFKSFEDRKHDYEFDKVSGLPNESGLKFYEFLEMELIPHLEASYKLASLKMIAGHGASAGFINFFLYKENPVFNAYFSFNPELPDFVNDRIPMFLTKTTKRYFYYLSFSDSDSKKIKKSVPELHEKIKSIPNPLLTYDFNEFKKSSHHSSLIPAIPDALSALYDVYQPITIQEFQDKIVKLEGNYTEYLVEKYKTIHELLGMKMNIRYNDFKAIEAAIVKNKMFDEFEKLSKLAQKEHPKTMLANYYMALFYYNMGDLTKSLREYQKAFALDPFGDLNREMIMDKIDAVKAELGK